MGCLALVWLLQGCSGCSDSPSSGDASGGHSGATGSTDTQATSTEETTGATVGQHTGAASPPGPENHDTSSTSSTGAGDDTWGGTPPTFLDLPPFPAECYEPAPTIVVERAESPQGTLSIEEAWITSDYCSFGPSLRLHDPVSDLELTCVVGGASPFLGVRDCEYHRFDDAETVSIEVLEPYDDPDFEYATSGVHLHALLQVQGGGWDLRIEVDVPECGEWSCYCPCE